MRKADKSRGAGLLVLVPDMETTKICNFPRSDLFSHTFIICHHFGDVAFKSATDERGRGKTEGRWGEEMKRQGDHVVTRSRPNWSSVSADCLTSQLKGKTPRLSGWSTQTLSGTQNSVLHIQVKTTVKAGGRAGRQAGGDSAPGGQAGLLEGREEL